MSSQAPQGPSDQQKTALVERIVRGEITAEQARAEHGLSAVELEEWVGVYRRSTWRAMDERLTAALAACGLPAEGAVVSEFTGNLESLALVELIQTIQYARQDAQILIGSGGEQGQIWCEQGEVVDACSGALAGTAAFQRLLGVRRGRVQARFARAERERTIHVTTGALLLEAAQHEEECRQRCERIGDLGAVYAASPHAWAREAEREAPETWQVLRAFDGATSVEGVLSKSALPERETLACIEQLLEQELLIPAPAPAESRWLPLGSPELERGAETSFMPMAASLRARLSYPGALPRRLWLSAAAGAASVTLAFGAGWWLLRSETPAPSAPPSAVASAGDWALTAAGECPPGMARMASRARFAESPSGPGAAPNGAAEPVLAAFCLSQHEVTVEQFEACVAAGGCEPAQREYDLRLAKLARPNSRAERDDLAVQCNSGQAGRERYPINCVNFQQARQFCGWRGGRLPTQAEWEYAAEGAPAPSAELHRGTLPVGSDPAGATPEGLLDLLGNVSEWTTSGVGMRAAGGNAGPDPGTRRELYAVLGGGAQPGANRLGSRASRLFLNADARGRQVGFRCAFGGAGER